MAPKPIPDRWLDYSPIGERIAGTRFIAFKVPLLEHVITNVDAENRLDPDSLLQSVPNLGIIIDLTATFRYYDPRHFLEQNVQHQKVLTRGHETPSKKVVRQFCKYVNDFLKENSDNDKLIGVHCTHGVNRTGYLICYYIIKYLNLSPEEAMHNFASARGHNIERQNYVASLRSLKSNAPQEQQEYDQHRQSRYNNRPDLRGSAQLRGQMRYNNHYQRYNNGNERSGFAGRSSYQQHAESYQWTRHNEDNRYENHGGRATEPRGQRQDHREKHERYDNEGNRSETRRRTHGEAGPAKTRQPLARAQGLPELKAHNKRSFVDNDIDRNRSVAPQRKQVQASSSESWRQPVFPPWRVDRNAKDSGRHKERNVSEEKLQNQFQSWRIRPSSNEQQ